MKPSKLTGDPRSRAVESGQTSRRGLMSRHATSIEPMSPDLFASTPGPFGQRSGEMRLCVVEDLAVAGLEPLTLTRPMYELWLGCTTLGCKIASAFGVGPGPQRRGSVVRSHLVAVQRERDPHMVVNDRDWLARGPVIVANARWVPPSGFEPPDSHGPWVGLCDGQPACALVGPEDAVSLDPHGIDSWFEKIASRHSGIDMGGEWIFRPWDLVARNGAYIERGFQEARRSGVTNRQLSTLALVGPSNLLRVHETARLDPSLSLPTSGSSHSRAWRAPVTSGPRPNFSGPTSGARSRSAPTAGSAARSRPRSYTASPTSITRAFWGTPTSASGSTWAQSLPTAICGTITARCLCRSREIRCRPGRPRLAALSAIIREPGWGRCSTPARPSVSCATFFPPVSSCPSTFPRSLPFCMAGSGRGFRSIRCSPPPGS